MEHSARQIRVSFEQGFLQVPLASQIQACDRYELAPLFESLLAPHQPVLEAGCGSGRWVGWFANKGWRTVGLDWSRTLCQVASQAVPNARFVAGDMREMPFADGSFGAILALGAVEHAIQGPEALLREFHRVLADQGVVILTIPQASRVRRWTALPHRALTGLKGNPFLRRCAGKPVADGPSLTQIRQLTHAPWRPTFGYGPEGWFFYEYHFTMEQMRRFLEDQGFQVRRSFAAFKEEGLLHNFGRLCGVFDAREEAAKLNPVGKLLARILPTESVGLMACLVAVKR
ncbi:MAG: class I SAM-dependent methyltransferase [Magnetococcales bacterium]|nr:class I SAM-dependent methyltransferase [Magnetococcales bacterium]